MIDQIDKRLRDWIQKTLDVPEPTLLPPSDDQKGRGVSLYLLELMDKPPTRGTKRPPLQLSLRYLVTTWAKDPEKAHQLLGDLVFAAMEKPEFEVDLDPIPATAWAAFGVIPRPSFILRVPLQKKLPEPPIKYVLEPLVIKPVAITTLRGIVLGPDDVPLVRAVVEVPALQLTTRTDAKGQFEFSSVPSEPRTKAMYVRAKGQEFDVTVEHPVDGEQIVIRFDSFK